MTRKIRHAGRAFTLAELLVVLAILGMLALVLAPSSRRNRCGGFSKRLVCASNLKGIGTSMKIYANENHGSWPMPPFDQSLVGRIDYTMPAGAGVGSVRSPSRRQQSTRGPDGARQLTTTRAFWMLVRSGDVTVKQFICPNAGDTEDPTPLLNLAYDFIGPRHLSYGFQVPYGPPGTEAHERMDNRMILAADKGPYTDPSVAAPTNPAKSGQGPALDDLKSWSAFNSRNHQGEGQNMLFADGHANFSRVPTAGVDADNIYTVALDSEFRNSRAYGESPWAHSAPPASSTDSVIFP